MEDEKYFINLEDFLANSEIRLIFEFQFALRHVLKMDQNESHINF
jgi:hypothetical protein